MIFVFFLLELEGGALDSASSVDQLVGCGIWKDVHHENMNSFELFAIFGRAGNGVFLRGSGLSRKRLPQGELGVQRRKGTRLGICPWDYQRVA